MTTNRFSPAVALLVGVVLAAAGTTVSADDTNRVYVNRSAQGLVHDGQSWHTALLTVQAGLNAAKTNFEVWVAAGTYIERISLKDGVALYGGFAGTETSREQRNWNANGTILDGNQAGTVVVASNAVGVAARIDGFTIRNGKADKGGGVFCDQASPSIVNNLIVSNSATSSGGGIFCIFSSPTIFGNQVLQNVAKEAGGIDCRYSSSPLICSNIISGNSNAGGQGAGGGIRCWRSSPIIINNRISGNRVDGYLGSGGGIYLDSQTPEDPSKPIIANNLILDNRASAKGGGIECVNAAEPTIVNNTIVGNQAPEGGGIMNMDWGEPGTPSAVIVNNLIAYNSSGVLQSGGTQILRNNCVFGNTSGNYSGVSPGQGDISRDPLFMDRVSGNFHLREASPCIDAGRDEEAKDLGPDFDGQPRLQGAHVDIGADEFSMVVISPRKSGEILVGDALRFAADASVLGWQGAIRFAWDFGDGRSSALEKPGAINFLQAGTWGVAVTVSNGVGNHLVFLAARTITVISGTNSIPDLAVTQLNVPGNLAMGQPAPIAYTVRNAGDGSLSGKSWKDALYLSRDAHLDVNDRLLVSATVSKVVVVGGSYTNMLNATLPAVEEGAYYLLLSVDDEWQVLERHQLNNEFAVVTDLVIPRLTNAIPFAGAFAGNGDEHYFRIDVPAGQSLLIRLNGLDNLGVSEVYVRFGALPTRGTFDYQAATPGSADQQALISAAAPGTYYILVRGELVTGNGQFTLEAIASQLNVTGVTPDHHANSVDAHLALTGAGFDGTTGVALVSTNGIAYSNNTVSVDSFTQLTVTIPANSVPPGRYTVRVSQPDGDVASLTNAFTMDLAGQANLATSLIVPSSVGYHGLATHYIEFANTGNAAMPAPLLVLRGLQNGTEGAWLTLNPTRLTKGFWTSAQPEGFSHSIQVLASGATPGVLQPGETFRVPVYYAGWQQPWDFSYPPIQWQLGVVKADDATPVNWAEFKDSMKPATINAEAWDRLWANFVAQVGGTWGGYVAMLDDNAAYLGRLGERVLDLGDLLAFEFMQADGLNPMRSLAGAVDATVEAPGLPVTFSRSLSQSISRRYDLGPFGRGWSHNWQYSLTQAADGTVNITGPGGSRRTFQPDSREAYSWLVQPTPHIIAMRPFNTRYFATTPGEHGTLWRLAAGGFALQEANGLLSIFRIDGKLDYMQDLNGNRITAGYSGANLIALTHSSGRSLQIAYNGAGRIQCVTDPVGRQTIYTYDGDHLAQVQQADGRTTTYTYGSGHALANISGSCCSQRSFTYDTQGRLATTWTGQNEATVAFDYDKAGGVTVRDALTNTSRFYFDHRGLMVKSENALGHAVHLTFDENYNLKIVTDPAGRSYRYGYDSKGNLIASTDPLGGTTRFAFAGPWNRLSAVTDAKGNGTRYNYTPQGNLQAITYADGSVERWAYNATGLPTCWTNRRGQPIAYEFGTNAQLLAKNYPGGTNAVYEYNGRGNLVAASNETGRLVFTYDPSDRLTRIDYPFGPWLQFTYNEAGKRASSLDQLGHRLNYFYDSAGRLESMTDENSKRVVLYTYDPAGRLARKEVGNGMHTTYAYDPAGQVLHLVNTLSNGTVISRFDYTYDTRGRRTSMDTFDGKWDYGYDDLGQLTRAVFASRTNDIQNQDLTYLYDALGNRVRTIENGITNKYIANNMNQYVSVGGVTVSYDANGNMVADGSLVLAYDAENRLISATRPGTNASYSYDAIGRRIERTLNGVGSLFLYDGEQIVGDYDNQGSVMHTYVYGIGIDEPILMMTGNNSSYFAVDRLRSVVSTASEAGVPQGAFSYDAYGIPKRDLPSNENKFGFAGREYDQEVDAYFNRARTYSPRLGRFLQPDPLGQRAGLNIYEYAANNPVSNTDPLGLLVCGQTSRYIPFTWDQLSGRIVQTLIVDALTGEIVKVFVPAPIPGVLLGLDIVGWFQGEWQYPKEVIPCPQKGEMPYAPNTTEPAPTQKPCNPNDFLMGTGCWGPLSPPSTTNQPSPPASTNNIGTTGTSGSTDPNQKTGPAGYGAAGYVNGSGAFAYRVDFENQPSATAPAQQVVITDQLSTNLDWTSLELAGVGFGDQLISIPPHSQHFETSVSFTYSNVTFDVQIEAGVRLGNGQLYATFHSIDPSNSLPPTVDIGFLPPEDGTGRGMGHLSYTVHPKANLATGTQIRNVALISFDNQPAIATDQVDPHNPGAGTDPSKQCLNTIDAGAPSSHALVLPAQSGRAIPVAWTGQDDLGGIGIASYDIFVSTNGGPFGTWLKATSGPSAPFIGELGSTYAFYSIARDRVGNMELAPVAPDAQTLISTNSPLLAAITNLTLNVGEPFGLSNGLVRFVTGHRYTFSLDPWAAARGATINATNGTLSWTPKCHQARSTNSLTVWVTDNTWTNLSDAMTITAVVKECLEPTLGTLILPVGQTGRLPINLLTSEQLTNLTMRLDLPEGKLVAVNVEVREEVTNIIGTAWLEPAATPLPIIGLASFTNAWMTGTQQVAWLYLTAPTNQPSSFQWVHIGDFIGTRLNGTQVTNVNIQSGRVVVLADEPLLEAFFETNRLPAFMLYANAGTTNVLIASPDLSAPGSAWTALQSIGMSNLFQWVQPPATNQWMFYRAKRLP